MIDLDAIKARCEAGINGSYYGGEYIYTYDSSPFGGVVCMGCGTPIELEDCREHCAEADVLALIAEVERLQRLVDDQECECLPGICPCTTGENPVTDAMVERAASDHPCPALHVLAGIGGRPAPDCAPDHDGHCRHCHATTEGAR